MTHKQKFADRLPIYRVMTEMPPLSHWPDRTQPFDYAGSEVIAYLIERGATPEQAKAAFNSASGKGVIRFDPTTKLWTGTRSTAKLEAIEQRLSRTKRRRVAHATRQRAAKLGCKPADVPADGFRANSRLRSALDILAAWKRLNANASAWRHSDLVRGFQSLGCTKDTAKSYLRTLFRSGQFTKDESGAWSAEQQPD